MQYIQLPLLKPKAIKTGQLLRPPIRSPKHLMSDYFCLDIQTNSILRPTRYSDQLDIQTNSIFRPTWYSDKLDSKTNSILRQTSYSDRLDIKTDLLF